MKNCIVFIALILLIGISIYSNVSSATEQPTIIELTQTSCQFVESEGEDHGFVSKGAEDCHLINSETGKARLASANILKLKAGDYIFRVKNENVPYDLGFWLRGKGLGRLTLPGVSGGGIKQGRSRDYQVSLREGEYLYSCPLNPTPNYRLIVKP
ncbi:MAG: hypothetical protein ACE5DY_07305 [Mariprofundaceae bacterium]